MSVPGGSFSRTNNVDTVSWPTGAIFHFLAVGSETDGRYSVMEDWQPKGLPTPAHLHRTAGEAFYVLEGEITARIGREVFNATEGTYLYIPPQTPHSFLVTSEFARKLIIFSPPGTEEAFRQVFAPLPQGMTREQWVAQVLQAVDQELVQMPEI